MKKPKYMIGETVLIDGRKDHYEVAEIRGEQYGVAMLDPSPKDMVQIGNQWLRAGLWVAETQIKPIYSYDLRKPL